MTAYFIAAGFLGFVVFILLSPKWKILLSFMVMSKCFDLIPEIMFGKNVWDLGAIMLLIASLQLFARGGRGGVEREQVLTHYNMFIVWMILCLLYSLTVYAYPLLDTLKTSRHMILGFMFMHVYYTLFLRDRASFEFILKALYRISFALMVVAIIQYVSGLKLLFGLQREYVGDLRYIPIFLPVTLFYVWHILVKHLSGERLPKHEIIYAGLAFLIVATTYTRGIYVAVVLVFILMWVLLARQKQLNAGRATMAVSVAFVMIIGLLFGGYLDKVIGRAASGLDLIASNKGEKHSGNIDTFTGRRELLLERIGMVWEKNPIFGYGYIHEENVSRVLRGSIKYGTPLNTPEYEEKYKRGFAQVLGFYTPDIGWANIVISNGLVGLAIFMLFMVGMVRCFFKNRVLGGLEKNYRLASFLQIVVLLLLMFNGNTFNRNLQFPSLMFAVFLYSRVAGNQKDKQTREKKSYEDYSAHAVL